MTDRIKHIIEINQLTPSKFADEINIQRSAISHILSGRNKPSLDVVQKILLRFPDVDAHWLLTGNKSEEKLLTPALPVENISAPGKTKAIENQVVDKKGIDKIVIFYLDHTFEEYQKKA